MAAHGIKTVLNELLAYLRLAELDTSLSERTRRTNRGCRMSQGLCSQDYFG
jgi:nucleoside permease NupC